LRPAKNHGPLTYEQLRHIGQHAMDNGAELCAEARLLLDNGHHARAFGLSVLAVEETGKAFVCAVWAGKQPIATEASEWQQFWDHFKSHDAKYVWAVANSPDWGWNQEALRETERMAGERQENKWWSFYVSVHNRQTSVPALLDREPCEQHVELVEDLFRRVFDT
jgi:AbiV family abortive infection protein